MHAMHNRNDRAPGEATRRNLPGLDFEAPLCGEISTRVSSLDSSALSLFAFVVLTRPADLQ